MNSGNEVMAGSDDIKNLVSDSGKQSKGCKGEGAGGRGNWLMGIKEGMCCDENWVLYRSNESLTTTSKSNDVD